ncbi:hypothetical protein [Streptomyces sp. NBC_01481]|uniref:hypothetical protein n=1 Tax=Streptomyces sp. NBC_01481 TaxID=2975869 RepID=UPI00224F1F3D|nr:hypothetical protein [Streptomyces sp. NBC_01481]MCX4584861.1 hypothetical protein [Streptomyces sp. NBC_01481]
MRSARAGVFGVASAGLAGAGHHVAAAEPVAWPLLLAAAGLAFLGALPWARRRRSLGVVVAATCAAQLVLHELLARTGPEHHGVQHGHPMPMPFAHTLAALAVALLLQQTDDQLAAIPCALSQLAATVRSTVARWMGRWVTHPCHGPDGAPAAAGPRRHPGVPACAVLAYAVVRRGPPGHGQLSFRP